ncbi:MAG: GIY-YIG nuclease family protein [Chloroflexota bacterium]|nr:GIY-YIG nuclease family protein [Chloroflexota bacterium]
MSSGFIPGLISGYLLLAFAGPALQQSSGGIFGAGTLTSLVIHMLISMVVGGLYTGAYYQYVYLGTHTANVLVGGFFYGLFWWIFGENVVTPILAGGSLLQFSIGPAFFGYIMFGQVLAFLVEVCHAALGLDYKYMSKVEHPAGYVYEITDPATGLVKIGRTINPTQRMQQLQREHGKQLKYRNLRTSDNAPKDEAQLHKRFASRRKDGEWFDMN